MKLGWFEFVVMNQGQNDLNFHSRIMCRALANCPCYVQHSNAPISARVYQLSLQHASCTKSLVPALCPHNLHRSMLPIVLSWCYNKMVSNKCPVIGEGLLSGDFLQGVISFVAPRDSQISLRTSSWSAASVCPTVDQGCGTGGRGESKEESLQER